jgi:hypothetical protein
LGYLGGAKTAAGGINELLIEFDQTIARGSLPAQNDDPVEAVGHVTGELPLSLFALSGGLVSSTPE